MGLLACAISSTRKITKKMLEIFYLLHLAKSLFASSIVANIKLRVGKGLWNRKRYMSTNNNNFPWFLSLSRGNEWDNNVLSDAWNLQVQLIKQ